MTVVVELNQGQSAVIDDGDLALVNPHHWFVLRNLRTSYAFACIDGKTVYMHRLITGARSGLDVDHINHDGLDNRRSNLRVVTHAVNLENRRGANKNSSSGLRGVYKHEVRQRRPSGREYCNVYWQARVMTAGRSTTKNFPYSEEGMVSALQWAESKRAEVHQAIA